MMRRNVQFRDIACGLLLLAVTLSCSGDGVSVTVGGLRFVSQPSSVVAGQSFTVTVELISSGGRRVTGATDVVVLSIGGGATLGGTTSVPAIGGLATFSGMSITRAGSNFQLSASSGTFTNTGTAFTVAPGPPDATQSTLTLNPASLTTTGSSTATFSFKDLFGNPLAGMSVVLSSALGGVTFAPSSGTTLVDGTFSTTVSATSAGSASISATVGGAVVTIATPIVILPAATALRFVTQPTSVTAGQAFSVTVEFITAAGQRATIATDQITLTASGGVALGGITTVAATAGVATFDGLAITTATTGLQLTASGRGFTANGAAFNITAGPLTLAQSTLSFSPALTIGTTSTGTFTLKDAFGNALASVAVGVTSSIAGTTFVPGSGTTSATGSFASQVTPGAVGSGTITATVGANQAAFPVTVAVAAGVCTLVGSMALGTPVNGTVVLSNGCMLNGHSAAVYRLTVPDAGTSTVVAVTGTGVAAGFFPELTVTPDPPGASLVYYGNSTQTAVNGPREWLLPNGAFQVRISSSNGNGGAFTLGAVSAGVGAAGCVVRVLVNVNATYTGQSLASTDCLIGTAPNSYYLDVFSVYDGRPCTITLRAAFDAWLEIRDAAGNLVYYDDDGGGGSDSQISLAACNLGSAGTARIWPSSYEALITGPYTLTVTFTGSSLTGLRSGQDAVREFPMGAILLPFKVRPRK